MLSELASCATLLRLLVVVEEAHPSHATSLNTAATIGKTQHKCVVCDVQALGKR